MRGITLGRMAVAGIGVTILASASPAKAAIYSALTIVIGGVFKDYKGARLRPSLLHRRGEPGA